MYKDLSLKERAKVLLYGGKLGLTSVEDIAKLYDDAISHKFAEGSMSTPDWDPNNPYHYHTANGEKVVITPEDWEKHKGLPYFKLVEDAVLAELATHPGPEYIINPQFSEDLRRVYKGNMGPLYQNYSSFSGNLPQGYSFTPEGLVSDNQGNLYVLKGFRQSPRFTYDESNPLTFPVLEGRNQGNVTFYPVNMERTIKPSLPVSSIMNVDKEHESAIKKAQNQYEYPVTLWDILPTGEGVISTYDNVYSTSPDYGDDYSKNYHPYKDKGAKQFFENYISNIIGREIKLNGPSYMWDDNGNFRNVYADDVFNLSPKEFNLVKKKLKEAKNRDYEFEKKKTEENLNKFKQEGILMGDDEDVYRNSIKYYEDWINQDNPWLWGADEDRSPKPRKISRKEAEKKAVIEVGPLQLGDILTYAQGGPIVSPYGQWKYPGRDTIIPSNNITMDNVNYPVLGVSDTGDTKVMMPWNDYKFRGSMVYEHPLISNQFQLGGNTKPTFDLWYPIVPNQKNDTSSYDLRRAYNMLPFDEMEKFRTINDYHLPSVAYDEKTDTYTFLKRNGHPTLNYELDWYNSGNPDALEFRERYKLDTLNLPWRYIPNIFLTGGLVKKPEPIYNENGQVIGRRYVNKDNSKIIDSVVPQGRVNFQEFLKAKGKKARATNFEDLELFLDSLIARGYNEPLRLAFLATSYNEMDNKGAASRGIGGNGYMGFNTIRMPLNLLNDSSKLIQYILDDTEKLTPDNWTDGGSGGPYIKNLTDAFNKFWNETNPNAATLILNKANIRPAKLSDWYLRASDADLMKQYIEYPELPKEEEQKQKKNNKLLDSFVDFILSGGLQNTPNYADGGNLFKKGGIYIKPENRGKFTALKKRTGHSASWFKAHGTPALKKMATFELNSRHWNKHALGGYLEGGIYDLPEEEINRLIDLGYEIEYL